MIEFIKEILHVETTLGLIGLIIGVGFFFSILWWFAFGEGLERDYRKHPPWNKLEKKWREREEEETKLKNNKK